MAPGLLLAFLAIGLLAGALLARRRAPPFPLTAEDCVAAADAAMGKEQWALAAEWLERARRLAPTSARVCLDLAFALHQRGDPEAALRMCDEARRLGAAEGETRLLAAIVGSAGEEACAR